MRLVRLVVQRSVPGVECLVFLPPSSRAQSIFASDPRAYARSYLLPSALFHFQPPDAASVGGGVECSVFLMVDEINHHRVW